jgi:hypothetical protein
MPRDGTGSKPVTVTWRARAFLATEVDATWTAPRTGLRPGKKQRMTRRMSDPEIAATVDVLRRVPAAISAWSEGAAGMELLDVMAVAEPIRRLTPIGDGRWWLGPEDLPRPFWDAIQPGSVDAIYLVWPSDGAMPLCGWGCTVGPGPGTKGAGFSSIISDGWAGYPGRLHPEEGFVHEWLHQVESVLRGRGVGADVLPGLHDVDGRTSCRTVGLAPFGRTYPEHHQVTDTWQPWYRDLMTGTVRGRDVAEPPCLGLRPEHWAQSRS